MLTDNANVGVWQNREPGLNSERHEDKVEDVTDEKMSEPTEGWTQGR